MYKRLFLFLGIAILPVLLWSLVGKGTSTSYEDARELLLYRRIGHELLLSTGDTKSRVLPVKKISDREFRIEFEKTFSFETDSLVAVVGRILNRDKYMVNVTEVVSGEVVYNFALPAKKEELACSGRLHPAGNYAISILLEPAADELLPVNNKTAWLTAGLLGVCLVFFGWRFTRKNSFIENTAEAVNTDVIPIGRFRFYPARHLLLLDETSIELTAKEAKLLRIFCEAPNEVIDRNQLLKEGWEDEGVITGRSLDMYVSKLRKKLQSDPSVGIINVHGKGYKLNC